MYTIYHNDGDTQVFERPNGEREKNEFVFTGFSNGIHPYHRKQLNWLKEMLKSAGAVLHIKEVPTVYDIGENVDNGEFELSDLKIDASKLEFNPSGPTYLLIQDVEMGRGWAVLIEATNAGQKIIMQEHRDTVRDEMLSEKWLKARGVSVKYKIDKIL